MNFEKRYKLQVKINNDLRQQISELTIENQRLKRENEWNNSVKESQQEEFQGTVSELDKAYKEFKEGLVEIKEKKKALDSELKLAQQERAKYKKKMDKFMKQIARQHGLTDE